MVLTGGDPADGATLFFILMLLIEALLESPQTPDVCLTLPFEKRGRSRQRTVLDNGEEAGLLLPQGTVLRDGQLLLAKDGRVVQVRAAVEPLYEVESRDPVLLARAAYHVGNRHVALEIGAGYLRLLQDTVLKTLLEKLGLTAREINAAFEPEAGAYGGGHYHHGEEKGHGGLIHHFTPRN